MKKVDFTISVVGGAGIGVFIKVDGHVLHFASSSTQSVDLAPGDYTAALSGAEPSSASVNIQVIENGAVLANTTYDTPTFWGFLAFTVN